MEALIKDEVNKLLDIGKENGGLQTSTIVQLLNDLGKMSDLTVDDSTQNRTVLDSSKIAILPKTLSVEAIVKKSGTMK